MTWEYIRELSCHNCGHGCCCKCENKNCYYCKKVYTCYKWCYKNHVVCFNCRILKKEEEKCYEKKTSPCSRCNRPMIPVSKNLRFPKKSDLRSWKLIERILLMEDPKIENSVFSHISKYSVFDTNHMDKNIRKLFSYPKKLSELEDFEKKLKTVVKI
jgi:hypothetical protein